LKISKNQRQDSKVLQRVAIEHYKCLWYSLNKSEKKSLSLYISLVIFSSVLEMACIGGLVPLIGILFSKEASPDFLGKINTLFLIQFNNPENIKFVVTALFVALVYLNMVSKSILNYCDSKLVYKYGERIGNALYEKFLYEPYIKVLKNSHIEMMSDLTHKVGLLISSWCMSTLSLIASLVLFSMSFLLLLWLSPVITILCTAVISLFYICSIIFLKGHLKSHSKIVSSAAAKQLKLIEESNGNLKDVILHSKQNYFYQKFKLINNQLRVSQRRAHLINVLPRNIIEANSIVLVSIFAYMLSVSEYSESLMLIYVGVLAMATQKMLPLINQIYNSYVNLTVGIVAGGELLKNLNVKSEEIERKEIIIRFERCVELVNISFKYDQEKSQNILNEINLKIFKNDCVGIKGVSGGGKSTLGDILLGLLTPGSGVFYVDNIPIEGSSLLGWRRLVSHVPQSVYLSDDTILKNIVFGTDELINYDRLKRCIEMSSLTETIKNFPEGLDTKVGNRGIGLSGGQRQRIGIARALYEGAEFIVFDEPTSSQDPVTCAEITSAINSLIGKKTIVIISHDYEIFKICNRVYDVRNNKIVLERGNEK